MTVLLMLFLLLAAPALVSLDQVKAEPDPERRAKAAIDFAATAERNAEVAFTDGNVQNVVAQLKIMKESMETTRDSLVASRKTPGRNPQLYKYFELRSHELLIRLEDFERRMSFEDRDVVAVTKARVQEIHDFWFDGIMGRNK
jgi:hypothetical protein